MTAFGYTVLMGSEGIALYLRKPWARWFTIIATSSLIPVEVYRNRSEVRRLPRALVLVVNVAIVAYLWRQDLLEED